MNDPFLLVLAGPNGSGKSTVLHNYVERELWERAYYINPDYFYQNVNTSRIPFPNFKKWEDYSVDKKSNYIIETVLANGEVVSNIQQASRNGYFVKLLYIYTDNPDINIRRIRERSKKGGLWVPEDYVVEMYYKSLKNLKSLINIIDIVEIYNNTIERVLPTKKVVYHHGHLDGDKLCDFVSIDKKPSLFI